MSFDGGDFESWLEQGLNRALNTHSGPSPLATQASYHAAFVSGGAGLSLSSLITASLTSKLAAGAATATLIVGGGTVAAATAATGSANPSDWGQYISQTVVPACKAQLASGEHGIGDCVASIARQHGEEVASAARHHQATEAKENEAQDNKKDHGEASEARGKKPAGHPSQKPSEKPEKPDAKPSEKPETSGSEDAGQSSGNQTQVGGGQGHGGPKH